MTDDLIKPSNFLDELADRCVRDLEPLSAREAVWKYPLLTLVVAKVLPTLSGEELAMVVSVAAQRGLIEASQECRGCAQQTGTAGNLCGRCYERVLREKFSDYA